MKIKAFYFALLATLVSISALSQNVITIKGKVEFPDNKFKMQIIERQGFDVIVHDSCEVDDEGKYEFKMKVDKPGVYNLDCQKWQSVSFWAEDEDLNIDFRGMDTARIKIKNPPYVYINGGLKNELLNLYNWDNYRNYQSMIGISQNVYRIEGLDDAAKQEVSGKFYSMLSEESHARVRYLAEHYADRNSVLAILPRLSGPDDEKLVEKVVSTLEKKNPNYPPLIQYKKDVSEAKAQKERLADGKKAPEFSFPTPDGKSTLGPQDFKGKILVIDFWASWCGPCIKEIPNLKEDYAKFADKGVEILSVSIDSKEADWKRAMEEQKMPWYHALAPNSGKDVMKLYQFSGIPHILVIDREGNIVAKNVRGVNLTKKLEELTSEKKTVIGAATF